MEQTPQVYHGPSSELAAELARWLAVPAGDPFTRDLVCVPTPGVERWLTQQFAGRFGICAAIDFRRLDRLTDDVLAAVTWAEEDLWQPAALTWGVLEVLDEVAASEPVLARHLDSEFTRRSVLAGRIATLLVRYGRERPELLALWTDDQDVDELGRDLDPVDRWQPKLWRTLRARITGPDPATRLELVGPVVAASPDLVPLPTRLAVFGPTRLNRAELAVLAALGQNHDVSLWLPHPSPALWEKVAAAGVAGPMARAELPETAQPSNVLLERLGREAVEVQIQTASQRWPSHPVIGAGVTEPANTALARLQQAVQQDEPLTAGTVPEDDHSIQFHQCHGPDRQVEVLRESILGLLSDDPTLEPRDIIVQCPAIDSYAPLLHASFGLEVDGAAHPGLDIPVRLADRSLRETNPVLQTLASVLELPTARATRSELLDLCALAPVARRFGWNREGQLDRLTELLDEAGVNWGLDLNFRQRYRVGYGQNTWSSATDRLLLGILRAEDDEHHAGTAVPLGRVESSDTELIGHFAEFTDRISALVQELDVSAPLPVWVERCHRVIDELTAVAAADSWQNAHAHGVLADLHDQAPDSTADLHVSDLTALLADAFAGRPTRTNFGTGALTICTLTPMRTVPHRVVILLGLDDGVFPRRPLIDGDDLTQRHPRVGDADPRAADRQALLDAVLSAGERLVVIHRGFDESTNQPVAPAPPVQDLIDACRAVGVPAARLRRVHPIQSHGPGEFGEPPFSFDQQALEAARTSLRPAGPRPPIFTRDPLPAETSQPDGLISVDLRDLIEFFRHPVKYLLRTRGGLVLPDDDQPDEQLPMAVGGLQAWQVRNRLLTGLLHGAEPERLLDVERRRGQVPPGIYGTTWLNQLLDEVRQTAKLAQQYRVGTPRPVSGSVEVGPYRVSGSIGQVHGDQIVTVIASWPNGARRFTAWLQLLVATALTAGPWQAVTIGKGGRTHVAGPISRSTAQAELLRLIHQFRDGRIRPLLWPVDCAAKFVEGQVEDRDRQFAHDQYYGLFVSERQLATGAEFERLSRDLFGPVAEAERQRR